MVMNKLSNEEAWKRAQFASALVALKTYIDLYEDGELSVDELTAAVSAWNKNRRYVDPAMAAKLREEWVATGSIEVFRHYGELGMSQREMGKVCGVSAAAISRWLNGTRTKRSLGR